MAYQGERTDSPRPVMTFEVGGSWLAVRVDQIDRVAVADRLWLVPSARPEHAGLYDTGRELVPVFALEPRANANRLSIGEQLIALLYVRGHTVGLMIDRAGQVRERYWFEDTRTNIPSGLEASDAVAAMTSDTRFWLVDADRLFLYDVGGSTARAC